MKQALAQTRSPIDDSIVYEQPYFDDRQITAAIASARVAQAAWRETSLEQRSAICQHLIDYFVAQREQIAEDITRQMGRPIVQSGGEVNGLKERGEHMIAIAQSTLADRPCREKPGFQRFIRSDPVGVVLVVAPWNYPLLTTVNSVIPALMAGNAVLIKPAAQTPLAGVHFYQAAKAAGAPEGLLQALCLDHEATQKLLQSGHINHCSFTGSIGAGQRIESALAGNFASLTLELGGKDPAYVCHDADLDSTLDNLVDGSYFNSGQSCCAIERIYVDNTLYDSFVEGFVERVKRYHLGNPLDEQTNLGPVVRASAAQFIREQNESAVRAGATACIDPSIFAMDDGAGAYLAPQVMINVSHDMSLMREESFGPTVGIMPVASDKEAIALMNDSNVGLSASIWSSDAERAEQLGHRVETGTVFMNRCDYLDPELVWTGVKQTGKGYSLAEPGYAGFVQLKSFHFKLAGN